MPELDTELEVTIKFKYKPNTENYDHLEDPSDLQSIIDTDLVAFKEDPYILSEYWGEKDEPKISIMIVQV